MFSWLRRPPNCTSRVVQHPIACNLHAAWHLLLVTNDWIKHAQSELGIVLAFLGAIGSLDPASKHRPAPPYRYKKKRAAPNISGHGSFCHARPRSRRR